MKNEKSDELIYLLHKPSINVKTGISISLPPHYKSLLTLVCNEGVLVFRLRRRFEWK